MTDAYGGIGGGAVAEYAISETGGGAPSLLDTLRAGDFSVVVVQEMRAVGSDAVYRMYLSDSVWTTLPTDTIPNMTLGGEIDAGPVVDGKFSFGRGAQNNGEQAGSVDLIVHPDGVAVETVGVGVYNMGLTRIRREKVIGGWPTTILIGYPAFGLDSFNAVWTGVGEDLTADGLTKAKLTFRDNRAALSLGVLSTFAGTGGAEGSAELAGRLKPRHYGAPKNVSPVLIDATNNIYFCSDRAAITELSGAFDGAKAYTADTTPISTYAALLSHSVASGSWAQAIVSGVGTFVKLGAAPTKRLTVDFADFATVPQIIRAVLETAGLASSAIVIETEDYPFGLFPTDHSQDWQAAQDIIQNVAGGYCYISEQATPNDIVDNLCKGVGWSRYLDDLGRETFFAPDYALNTFAVSGVDYVILSAGERLPITNTNGTDYAEYTGGDILTIEEIDLPAEMWPPNGRERLLSVNHSVFTETDVLANAAAARKEYSMKKGDEVTAESSIDIFASLKNAVDPDYLDTHFVGSTYLNDLGRWLLRSSALSDGRSGERTYPTKRRLYEITLPMDFYVTLPAMTTVKFQHPSFYADEAITVTGQVVPVETDWQARTRKYAVYGQGQQYKSIWEYILEGPEPPSNLEGVKGMARSGYYVFAACGSSGNLAVIGVSLAANPTWVDEFPIVTTGFGDRLAYIAISGTHAFLTSPSRNSVFVVDISTPTVPVVVTEFTAPTPSDMQNPQSIVIADGYAYVACYDENGGIAVINISTPSSPTWAGRFDGPILGESIVLPWGLCQYGNYLLATTLASSASQASALAVIDISSPGSPAWVSKVVAPSETGDIHTPFSVAVSGTTAYLTNYSVGALSAIDLSDPAAPVWSADVVSKDTVMGGAGERISSASPTSVAVSGSYVYMASDDTASVSVFDITNPLAPIWVSQNSQDGSEVSFGEAFAFPVGDYVYIASPRRSQILVLA